MTQLRLPAYLRLSAPPKEGRIRDQPYGLLSHIRWRTTITRFLLLSLTLALVLLLVDRSSSLIIAKPLPIERAKFAKVPRGINQDALQQPIMDGLGDDELSTPNPPKTPHEQPVYKEVALGKVNDNQPTRSGESSNRQLEAALAKVLSRVPNEFTRRELLRPVKGTGKEKLREMGLRARAYKHFLEDWEALHFVSTGDDDLYIRDDIIQYLRNHQDFAVSLSESLAETVRIYEGFRHFLQELAILLFPWTSPYFADHMTLHTHFRKGGRGIVLSSGDGQAPYLLTSIASFRKLGCTLPIEIMYLGEGDLSEDYRADLEALPGVVTRDVSRMVIDNGWQLRGWAAKPFAMLLSSFREVIFIDADALFFRDPEFLFDDPLYTETGTLFFKDRIIMPESKKQWLKDILPQPISQKARESRYWTGISGHMQESGVVVVDKWKHFVALLMVTRMNGPDRDGKKEQGLVGVYDMVYGDKETYWLGWELVGDLDYAFHTGDAGIIGSVQTAAQLEERLRKKQGLPKLESNVRPGNGNSTLASGTTEPSKPFTVCAPQLLHLDNNNRPLWFNGWILNNKFAEKKLKSAAKFEIYMREPTDAREPHPWQLQQSNEACLTADEIYDFTEDEMITLDMIIDLAKKTGAYGKS